MDLIVVVIQVGALGRNRPGRYRGIRIRSSWTSVHCTKKMCESICGSKLHYLCHVINILFIMTYYDCSIEAETVTFGHTGEEDVGNWVLLAQASQESVRFSEALGFVRNKIEQDPTQPLAMVITKSLLHLLVKGVEDPFCGQWW